MRDIVGFFAMQQLVTDNNGKHATENVLDFLLAYKDSINCFYHLSYNVACLLRILALNKDQLKALYEFGEVFIEPDYKIYFLHNKYFAIKKGFEWNCPYVQFCDISQYIPWKVEDNYGLEYAVENAKTAKVIGQLVYQALCKLGLEPDNLTSPIRVFEKGQLNRYNLPTVDDIPKQAGQYAYQCTHGGWLEAFKKGHWQKSYDYDISSAYPSELAKLLELRNGVWTQSKDYQPDAEYGYLNGYVTISSHFSPIFFKGKDMTYTPVGSWPTTITKKEYETIYKYGLGSFNIHNAWWWTPKTRVTPLKSMIDRLYQVKESVSGLEKDVVKRIMSGIWGKLLEVKGDSFGDHFNPVWGAEVEVNTRLEVFSKCMDNALVPLSIAVDGLLTDKPMELLGMSNGLGTWKLSTCCSALVISSGIVAVKDKEHNHDFSLDYDWLIEQIKQFPGKSTYEKSKLSPVSLDKSFNYNDIRKLGTVEQITRTIDVEFEQKRCYIDKPQTGIDLLNNQYKSVAWEVGFLE